MVVWSKDTEVWLESLKCVCTCVCACGSEGGGRRAWLLYLFSSLTQNVALLRNRGFVNRRDASSMALEAKNERETRIFRDVPLASTRVSVQMAEVSRAWAPSIPVLRATGKSRQRVWRPNAAVAREDDPKRTAPKDDETSTSTSETSDKNRNPRHWSQKLQHDSKKSTTRDNLRYMSQLVINAGNHDPTRGVTTPALLSVKRDRDNFTFVSVR